MDWVTFWDGSPSVYVNARHKSEHYAAIAEGIIAYLPGTRARVLDYGCGEALSAQRVAQKCLSLTLSDAAPSVVDALRQRYQSEPAIIVCDTLGLARVAPGSFDLIVVNSVVQYLDTTQFSALLAEARRLLAPGGQVLFADIIPPGLSPIGDALQLLKFALKRGFFFAAGFGLVRTLLSDYAKIRAKLGFAKYDAEGFVALLGRHGFAASPAHPNLGHNHLRLAFRASPV